MKVIPFVLVAILILVIGYLVYVANGMSSTLPALKEYHYAVDKVFFDKRLANRLDSLGWSFKKEDSIIRKDEACYWVSIFYKQNGNDLQYSIKYCLNLEKQLEDSECVNISLIGAFDFAHKKGGYRFSDDDVPELINGVDKAIFNGLAPSCPD